MNPIEKNRTIQQEVKALSSTDIKVILGNIVGAMKNFKEAKDQRASNYWKGAVEHWIETARACLKDKDPDYLKVEVLERMKSEFVDGVGALRKIDEDGIDLIVDDILTRFNVIVETTRINDLSGVKNRIVDRIREVNTMILTTAGESRKSELAAVRDELIDLNSLIPK